MSGSPLVAAILVTAHTQGLRGRLHKGHQVMNPWGRDDVSPERAVLSVPSVQPQNVGTIARAARPR